MHVNHLNRALRTHTGKTTSAHITERLISEAKALLQHTSWSTAEIAYGLGFEYPTYFNNFFKKQTGTTPSALRARLSQDSGTPPAVLNCLLFHLNLVRCPLQVGGSLCYSTNTQFLHHEIRTHYRGQQKHWL